jgi:BMFP domain-containing protein YqiC
MKPREKVLGLYLAIINKEPFEASMDLLKEVRTFAIKNIDKARETKNKTMKKRAFSVLDTVERLIFDIDNKSEAI